MKKITILAAIILLVFSYWFYHASNFEKMVHNDILPKLEKDEYLLLDKESVEINKFTFSVKIQDVHFFPLSKTIPVQVEEVNISYNPFTKNIHTSLDGDKIRVGTEVYIKTSKASPSLSLNLRSDDLNDFKFDLKFNEFGIYLSKDDSLITNFGSASISSLSEVVDNTIKADYGIKIKQLDYSFLLQYLENKTRSGSSESDFTENHLNLLEIIKSIGEKTDFELQISQSFNKKDIQDLIQSALLNNKSSFYHDILSKLTNTDYYFKVIMRSNNKFEEYETLVDISSDGKNIESEILLSSNQNYTQKQKDDLLEYISFNYKNSVNENNKQIDLWLEYLKYFIKKMLDINSSKMELKSTYDIESKEFENEFTMSFDDFDFYINGKINENSFNGEVTLRNIKLLIDDFISFYDSKLKQFILDEISNDKFSLEQSVILDAVMKNIKISTIDLLSIFNKNGQMKEEDDLIFDLFIDLISNIIKINDKTIFEYFQNETIAKFITSVQKDINDKHNQIINSESNNNALKKDEIEKEKINESLASETENASLQSDIILKDDNEEDIENTKEKEEKYSEENEALEDIKKEQSVEDENQEEENNKLLDKDTNEILINSDDLNSTQNISTNIY